MGKFLRYFVIMAFLGGLNSSCNFKIGMKETIKEETSTIQFMTLDPGHFHAGLIHKNMYPEVDSTIYIFAPEGPELKDHLQRISGYNLREDNPTAWQISTSIGDNFLQKMIKEKPGNVMVTAGKNDQKIDYILEAVSNGIHVYADKPLVINQVGFQKLKDAFAIAEENDLLLYDIMTERFEISSILQREFSMNKDVFGEIEKGSVENPAITKESVHHFFKYVSGKPLVRPEWFFDIEKEGDGLVDVTTHLVDLIQWELYPNEILDTTDVSMLDAKLWSTLLSPVQYEQVTGRAAPFTEEDPLAVNCNGEMNYTLKGVHAKVSVIWDFQAPEGAGDTHFSKMRGTKANLIIRQGEEENYLPELYIEVLSGQKNQVVAFIEGDLQQKFPGIGWQSVSEQEIKLEIPNNYRVGHEAHFGQVTEDFLNYFKEGALPKWEVPNMMVKYYTTTSASALAKDKN